MYFKKNNSELYPKYIYYNIIRKLAVNNKENYSQEDLGLESL